MNYQFTTTDGRKYLVEVIEDETFYNPLTECCSGDIQGFIDTKFCQESNCDLAKNFKSFYKNFDEIFGVKRGKKSAILAASEAGYVILPIWGYSHGEHAFTASYENPYDEWDSGLAGYIWRRNNFDIYCIQTLQDTIRQFDNWFNNEVWSLEFTSLENGTKFYGTGCVYVDQTEENIKQYCEDELGGGELEPYFGIAKKQLNKEDFNNKIESLLNDYWLNEISKQKVKALRRLLN